MGEPSTCLPLNALARSRSRSRIDSTPRGNCSINVQTRYIHGSRHRLVIGVILTPLGTRGRARLTVCRRGIETHDVRLTAFHLLADGNRICTRDASRHRTLPACWVGR